MGKASKGPSFAEQMALQAAADARAQQERDRLKRESDAERARQDNQMAFERESQAQRMQELQTQTALQRQQYTDQLTADQAKEEKRLLEEQNQEALQVQMEQEKARNNSELNSAELAAKLARDKTFLGAYYALDDDNAYDQANQSVAVKRKNAAKAM